jgi:hypothetical protein
MKTTITILLIVFSMNCFAQTIPDCSKYIVTKTDKMTGETSTMITNTIVLSKNKGKSKIEIDLIYQEFLMIMFTAIEEGSGCCDKGDIVNILFKDGSRISLYNRGDFNCDGDWSSYFLSNKDKDLIQLKSKFISTIRVNKTKSWVEIDLTDQQAALFRQSINCLSLKMK